MPTETAPCPWPVTPCGPLPAEAEPEYAELQATATDVLWALSGRQYGCCEFALRPCRYPCEDSSSGSWGARLRDGAWINLPCGRCAGDSCSCTEVCEVRLPRPVCTITEVLIDGEILDPSAYRVDNVDLLVRTDGGCWPLCQAMALPPTEVGTWQVSGTSGIPVPAAGQRALGELMSELWKACCGDGGCCLPKRVQSILTPSGPIPLLDPMIFLDKGKTGLYFTDLWLSAVNPQGRPSSARVLSPDSPNHRMTTWP